MKKIILIIIGIFLTLIFVGFLVIFTGGENYAIWYCYFDEYILREDQVQNDACYYEVAIYDGNFSVCNKIKDPFLKSQCFASAAITKEDISFCKKMEKEMKREYASLEKEMAIAECYFQFAVAKGDVSACDEIEGEMSIFCTALVKKDTSVCDGIESEESRELCHSGVSSLLENE